MWQSMKEVEAQDRTACVDVADTPAERHMIRSFIPRAILTDRDRRCRILKNKKTSTETCSNPTCKKVCQNPSVCAMCMSTPYCSRDCQVKHWKVHRKLCTLLNSGKAQQLKQQPPDRNDHTNNETSTFKTNSLIGRLAQFPQSCQEIYRLFKITTGDEDATILNHRVKQMKKLAIKISTDDKIAFVHFIVVLLLQTKSWQVKLATSPLLILLKVGVDVNATPKNGCYPCLAMLAAQHSTKPEFNDNQIFIGRQLIEVGSADVNLPTNKEEGLVSPLYFACSSTHCTNLDFVRLLLENRGNPNHQNVDGMTPLMNTLDMSISAAILMLKLEHENAVHVDVNICDNHGRTVLGMLKSRITNIVQQRETVARTGKGDPMCDKGWTTTEPYDNLLEHFFEMESLLEAKGAELGEPIGTSCPDSFQLSGWQRHFMSMLGLPKSDGGTTLEGDVSSLFKMDLIGDPKAPNWCHDEHGRCNFFIDDSKIMQLKDHEREDHLHSAGGCRPSIGQKIKIQCNLPIGSCRLVGKVVHTFRAPSDSDLRRIKCSDNPSMLYDNPCPSRGPCNNPRCALTKTGKRFEILRRFGSLHTQQVRGTVMLAREHKGEPAIVAFFGARKKYDVILRCNDHLKNMWEMARIEPCKSSMSHEQHCVWLR